MFTSVVITICTNWTERRTPCATLLYLFLASIVYIPEIGTHALLAVTLTTSNSRVTTFSETNKSVARPWGRPTLDVRNNKANWK